MVDAIASALADRLNGDCHSAKIDRAALQRAMQKQGVLWHGMVTERCQHQFADVPVFVAAAQMQQMRAVIAAVERVVALPGWMGYLTPALSRMEREGSHGVFFGYDFHLNSDGAHLIETNSNAGGGFLNALLLDSQREAGWPGATVAEADLEQAFVGMFREEWRSERGTESLQSVAIVDEQPEGQYLYPEFLLAQRMFERAGIAAYIADPSALHSRGDGVYLGDQKIDLVYNRLTDFSLHQHPALRKAYLEGGVVLTPNPEHYARYADKRNLARLTDAQALRALGADATDIATLQAGVPQTRLVDAAQREQWWQERKQWFFKPATGYGSKGSYSGAKLTRRVFDEIMQGGYVAQRMAAPGERMVCAEGTEPQPLKYDVRCYVYDGRVQLLAARLYQGQTTNFRTPGGGFAPVRVLG
ncbi:MAG: hypothetical protein A3F73_11215 [Gallionellales bacterium RIFCSPLOWO2_12_FULL_59_22]|nr:MAG: hypothetical protein A3H99_10940 [Gallionellales bacterium RIFCSPLOWO2_02_FULL_59_110]OGT04670.1 MAG: hypothetical protein A2Z65_05155 [Gallionellales bacterium RIFCSPLOWO2_02_58_13]OGT11849.1 MAG: hypothetical protein A3F73_11215 [Gallionellales bacterium RIFCSPLOWO2_12_FULL_59_22]